ncbi:MAG: GTP cyclohydrolase I FolE [Phycisphaerae bacterium]
MDDAGQLEGNRDARLADADQKGVDQKSVEQAVFQLLRAVGEDPDRDGLRDTPGRVARMYTELMAGLNDDPAVHLSRVFDESYDEIVLLRDIDFFSLCEHHLLPFHGKAHVAYLPSGKVVGLSKLARTVETFARRPQVQERLTCQIADALVENLSPHGVAVVIEAEHLCMKMRGVQKPNGTMVTSALRGEFKSNPSSRAEVLGLIRQG